MQVAGAAPEICRTGSTQATKSRTLTPKLVKILPATLFSTFAVSLGKLSLFLSPLLGSLFRSQAWGLDQPLNSSQAAHTRAVQREVGVSRTSQHQCAPQTRLGLH